eukprot:SM000114S24134  [mRNA]  locus=s114:92040:96093:- [translate_table: standard]
MVAAVAVSGGSDSMALSVLASRLGRRLLPQLRPVGLVVDHGLRPGSAAQADAVCAWLHKLVTYSSTSLDNLKSGLEGVLLRCQWPQGLPSSGHLQVAARSARYRLLEEACWDRGIGVLLTAHHADDQAELFLMRLARCSGFAGLAGTASSLHRRVQCPECGLPVATLMVCQDAGQTWMEDETNASLVFARNRVRAALCGPSGLCKADIQAVMALCQAARAEVEGLQEQLLLQSAQVAPDGYVTLNTKRLFQNAHHPYTSQKKPPRHSSIKQVVHFLASKQAKGALMVAGCLFHKHGGSEEVTVSRCPDPRRSAAVHISLAQIAAAKRPFVVHLDSKFLVSVDFDTQAASKSCKLLQSGSAALSIWYLTDRHWQELVRLSKSTCQCSCAQWTGSYPCSDPFSAQQVLRKLRNIPLSARWALPAVMDEAGKLLSLPVRTSFSKHNAEVYHLLRSAVRSTASTFFQVHLVNSVSSKKGSPSPAILAGQLHADVYT